MSEQKEYIVTVKSKDDLESFYNDIETPGGNLYIPNRAVQCCKKRPISRNTHYMLTDEEAEMVRRDPRVLAVGRIPEEIGIFPHPMFIQTETTWDKSPFNNSLYKNWGLLRCVEGEQRAGWGSNGFTSQTGTIQVNAEGRHVDVVVVDGMINPNHPEYAVNSDGSGGSRVIQYNWFQHALGQSSSVYVYEPYDDGNTSLTADNNHGAHVAGTVAGNTQGWARAANIYNINPYGSDINGTISTLLIDYIRAFHNSKPVNPATGRPNPTICNHSWGYIFNPPISQITRVEFRGNVIDGPFTAPQLNSYGIITTLVNGVPTALINIRELPIDVDMEDAIADGIIMVGAAGNYATKIDIPDGQDFDNSFIWNGFVVPYHQGTTPGASADTICVGAISSFIDESKADFSNCGPRVDIYAPGSNIISSFNSTTSYGGVNDPRDSNFKIGKISGTSMASPQVCGVLACALEIYPNLTQAQAQEYIKNYAKQNQITNTGGGFTDFTSLQGSDNSYLFYYKERADSGNVFPKRNFKPRPSAGAVFPRPRIRQTL